jgi:hypothetical protein
VSDQGKRRSRRVWSAEEITEQLDEVAEALLQGIPHLVRGFLLGVPPRRKPARPIKPPRPETEDRQ